MDTDSTPLVKLVNQTLDEYYETLQAFLSSIDTLGLNTTELLNISEQRKAIFVGLLKLDENLCELFRKVRKHQKTQKQIFQLQMYSAMCESATALLAEKIHKSKKKLEMKILEAEDAVDESKLYSSETRNVNELIDYSKRISPFTFAPESLEDGRTLQVAEPPYPSELKMRMGLISSFEFKDSEQAESAPGIEKIDEEQLFIDNEQSFDVEDSEFLLDLDLNPDIE
ncbi:hypothetical protein BB560_002266 [Smittium megazygosporum]|uniref:Mediator of RNA polymerase II transcription subunit 4 n=1 Tax=Smittium megazygosporum TaxID=133381 RepID=A0A2T9ZFD4_9FUNG|nr:hypothetical protein BB560_002266 [Smittium megazygosporum]